MGFTRMTQRLPLLGGYPVNLHIHVVARQIQNVYNTPEDYCDLV